MLNFYNKTNKMLQKGSAALIVIGALLIITAVALGVFNGIVPKTTVEVEMPKTKAEQKSPVKQTKTSFGAVQGLTKNLLNLNSEIASRSLAQEEKDLKLSNLVGAAKQRKILIKELMRENPRAFLVTAIKKNQRSLLPVNVQKDIEQETVITAKIEVMHIDDFENPENSRFEYFLRTKDAKLNFYPTNELYLVSGAEVKISGFQLDEVVVSDINKQNFQITKEAPPLESVGDQKTLVLLANFQNINQPSLSKKEIQDTIFNQVDNFYRENSYNKVWFSGDVVGWYNMPINQNCDIFGTITEEAIKFVDPNIDFNNYSRLIIIVPAGSPDDLPCYFGGFSTLGKVSTQTQDGVVWMSKIWLSPQVPYISSHIIVHELGHNFGFNHSQFCENPINYPDSCSNLLFLSYDPVGGTPLVHNNAFYKDYAGWFNNFNIKEITISGRYIIEPLAINSNNLKTLKIPYGSNKHFYIEYRRPIGYDKNIVIYRPNSNVLEGALFHFSEITETDNETKAFAYFTDPTPPPDGEKVALLPGETYYNPLMDVSITTVSATLEALTIDIKFNDTPLFITAPKDGDMVVPRSKVIITAEVSDEIKAQTERVEFYVNGARKCQDKTAPYSCNWTVPKKSGQTYEIQAKAYGNRKQSGVKPIAESEIIKVKAEKSANTKNDIDI